MVENILSREFRKYGARVAHHILRQKCGLGEPYVATQAEEKAVAKKAYRYKVCGYIYEGDELPADYTCPLCGQGADMFEEF